MAYKQDIDDYRESPALAVIDEFAKVQSEVDFYDPWIPRYKRHGVVHKGIPELTDKVIEAYDLVVITAAHTNVDYELIQRYAKAVFDTKNVMKNIASRENIETL